MIEETPKEDSSKKDSPISRLVLFLIKQSVLGTGERPSPESMWPLLAPVTADMTTLMRNVGYGGAATCLIIILSILQIGTTTAALKVSAVAAAVGMPLWLVSGLIYESYLSLDPSVYPHQRTPLAQGILAFIQSSAALAMFLSLFCLMHHITPMVAWLFLASLVLAVLMFLFFFFSVILYWIAQQVFKLFNIDLTKRVEAKLGTKESKELKP